MNRIILAIIRPLAYSLGVLIGLIALVCAKICCFITEQRLHYFAFTRFYDAHSEELFTMAAMEYGVMWNEYQIMSWIRFIKMSDILYNRTKSSFLKKYYGG